MTKYRTICAAGLAGLAFLGLGCGSVTGETANAAPAGPAEEAAAPATPVPAGPHARPGFTTREVEGRLWVFREGSKELAAFERDGELAKHVVRPGAGPGGMTVKAPDSETILEYTAAKDGFAVRAVEGRVWVFRADAEERAAFERDGELVKHVVRPGAGPGGVTLKAPDAETLDAYAAAREGFVTKVVDGRIWVFREGCRELAAFEKDGELAKHVVRPGAGPGGMTLKAPDAETLDAYAVAGR